MAESFSYPRWRSCLVKRAYAHARRAALDAAVLRLRGERGIGWYACAWAGDGRAHYHVGHAAKVGRVAA